MFSTLSFRIKLEKNLKQFRLHWLDGKKEVVEGADIAQAFTLAGYGAGALGALDWWEPA